MILYIILFVLAIHYSFPGFVLWLCFLGISWEAAKAFGRAISSLTEDLEDE